MGSVGTLALDGLDGRRARSAKTREAMVDAVITLLDEGDLKPTAAAIAARAGISVRSVFQHFTDLEDLFVAVADRQTRCVARLYMGTSYGGDLSSRIDLFVRSRATLYEAIAPIRRAALLQAPFSRVVALRLDLARNLHRLDVERAFGPELQAARASGDAVLGDTLAAMCSFVVWDEMRRSVGLELEQATAALRRMLLAVLGSRPAAVA